MREEDGQSGPLLLITRRTDAVAAKDEPDVDGDEQENGENAPGV